MNKVMFLLILILSVLHGGDSWAMDPESAQERTSTHTIKSNILGEDREIYVRVPLAYNQNETYPVVYVPDAELNFNYIANYLDYLANLYLLPKMIVTGSKMVNRNRDFIPKADPYFPYTGGAEKYLDFVKNEWIIFIDKNFQNSDKKILIGHSFGGVFALHTLFQEPTLFDSYIALGTSVWVSNKSLLEEAKTFFEEENNHNAFLYMSVGENDGGATVPTGNEMAKLFELNAPPSLDWKYEITPKTNHFTNFISGVHNAFSEMFPQWGFDKELKNIAIEGGVKAVNLWFKEKEKKLGYRFHPSFFDLGVAAFSIVREKQLNKEAIAIIDNLKKYFPNHPRVAMFSAMLNERVGQNQKALEEYLRTKKLTIELGFHPNIIQLPQLESSIERIKSKINMTMPL